MPKHRKQNRCIFKQSIWFIFLPLSPLRYFGSRIFDSVVAHRRFASASALNASIIQQQHFQQFRFSFHRSASASCVVHHLSANARYSTSVRVGEHRSKSVDRSDNPLLFVMFSAGGVYNGPAFHYVDAFCEHAIHLKKRETNSGLCPYINDSALMLWLNICTPLLLAEHCELNDITTNTHPLTHSLTRGSLWYANTPTWHFAAVALIWSHTETFQ